MLHVMKTTQPTLILRSDIVRALRETKGLESDKDLAAAMGIDPSSVSRVIRGRSQPGPKFIAALCFALETPINHLFAVIERPASKAVA